MIRPITFVTAIMALSSGAWMFVVKHRAEQLDRRIGGVTAQIRAAEARTEVLRAEWALETDPNRLARLAALFLPQLKPMLPDQMVTWSQLAARLPPVGASVPHLPLPPLLPWQLPNAGSNADLVAANASPASAAVLPLPPPAPRPATAQLAVARPLAPGHAAPSRPAMRQVVLPLPAHRPVLHRPVLHRPVLHRPVLHRPVLHHEILHHPAQLGRSVLAPTHRLRPMGAQVMTITARARPTPTSAPTPAPLPASAPAAGSVFGGYAANLAPPRPIGSVP